MFASLIQKIWRLQTKKKTLSRLKLLNTRRRRGEMGAQRRAGEIERLMIALSGEKIAVEASGDVGEHNPRAVEQRPQTFGLVSLAPRIAVAVFAGAHRLVHIRRIVGRQDCV